MNIYFFGTPEFAVPSLKLLSQDPYFNILGVVTQPDKPGDRNKITPPPVKTAADELNLPTLQPEKINKELIEEISSQNPDAIIVIAYGGLIPKQLLDIPKHGCINIHPSLLPKYRGASPIQEALLNGDTETGIGFMKLDEELDHGDIFVIKRIPIEENENLEALSEKLSNISAIMLPAVLKDIENETFEPLPQEHYKATFCRKIAKEEGQIDFNKPAQEILNQIRALNPWPGTYFKLKDKTIKILAAKITQPEGPAAPGTPEFIDKRTFGFHTKTDLIIPTKLQIEGKQPCATQEFLNGYKNLLT
ncbi:methionyl-tRNA formyltransferase [Candidatus Peregrinibacteria bacterium]|jgi:methionyl-tRNA formyltransferase|nr:methionyl-tRNA formyltransferase [Candidatus Peregrinibacteria bacterium]MBT4056416.1 methionyl-tRNA formyltransferase [Candidatus Peregrinibacteria bacterium]